MFQLAWMIQSPQRANPMPTLIMFGAIFAIFYFLLIRPQRQQQKAHNAMVQTLDRGDKVVTMGGVIGEIVHVDESRITIKTAGDTRLEVERAKIAKRVTDG